jgi:hypothetical protein
VRYWLRRERVKLEFNYVGNEESESIVTEGTSKVKVY